jgi:hypothetical protein
MVGESRLVIGDLLAIAERGNMCTWLSITIHQSPIINDSQITDHQSPIVTPIASESSR